jgi:hypothetical protein
MIVVHLVCLKKQQVQSDLFVFFLVADLCFSAYQSLGQGRHLTGAEWHLGARLERQSRSLQPAAALAAAAAAHLLPAAGYRRGL